MGLCLIVCLVAFKKWSNPNFVLNIFIWHFFRGLCIPVAQGGRNRKYYSGIQVSLISFARYSPKMYFAYTHTVEQKTRRAVHSPSPPLSPPFSTLKGRWFLWFWCCFWKRFLQWKKNILLSCITSQHKRCETCSFQSNVRRQTIFPATFVTTRDALQEKLPGVRAPQLSSFSLLF